MPSIFQFTKKILSHLSSYVIPSTYFTLYQMENMMILRENANKCVILNHEIHTKNIQTLNENTIEVVIPPACDLVFDFQVKEKTPVRTEMLCDNIVIHKNIFKIQYENAYPLISSSCHYLKIRLYFDKPILPDQIKVFCKYGVLPTDIRNQLKKVDVQDYFHKNHEWVVC